jgi:hypothetical protein
MRILFRHYALNIDASNKINITNPVRLCPASQSLALDAQSTSETSLCHIYFRKCLLFNVELIDLIGLLTNY